jgi:tetratricopeptide (TPR) repeat protein
MFRTVLGKRCTGLAFTSCGVIVETSSARCERCGCPMAEVVGLDRRLVLKLCAGMALAVAAIACLIIIVASNSGGPAPAVIHESRVPAETPSSNDTGKNSIDKLLQQTYSDGVKTADEEAKLSEESRELKVDAQWVTSRERGITDRVEHAAPFTRRGLLCASRQDYELAAKQFKQSLEAYDGNAAVWANLAAAYLKLNDLEGARSACDKALRLDSRTWLAHYNLGVIHAEQGNRDAAVSELAEALRLIDADRAQLVTKRQVEDLMRSDGSLERLRSDLRFQNLLARNQ